MPTAPDSTSMTLGIYPSSEADYLPLTRTKTEQVRKGLLMDLKKAGITEIRGIPVEDFLAVGVSDMRSKAEVNFKREKKRIAEQMANEGWI